MLLVIKLNALNRNSMFTSMLGGGMMMPTTVINNYTAALLQQVRVIVPLALHLNLVDSVHLLISIVWRQKLMSEQSSSSIKLVRCICLRATVKIQLH
ncbi:MAG: hypothetical protein CM15mV3_2520 [Caudoviricetes sp.]|nr:MAG: hypothetical protein CM15mV3_2520 [Caudoviricetes sp.]